MERRNPASRTTIEETAWLVDVRTGRSTRRARLARISHRRHGSTSGEVCGAVANAASKEIEGTEWPCLLPRLKARGSRSG
jgi:hypothetical protein